MQYEDTVLNEISSFFYNCGFWRECEGFCSLRGGVLRDGILFRTLYDKS